MDLFKTNNYESRLVEAKDHEQVLKANMLQLEEIQGFAQRNHLPFDEAAQKWIAENSEYWRKKHNTL